MKARLKEIASPHMRMKGRSNVIKSYILLLSLLVIKLITNNESQSNIIDLFIILIACYNGLRYILNYEYKLEMDTLLTFGVVTMFVAGLFSISQDFNMIYGTDRRYAGVLSLIYHIYTCIWSIAIVIHIKTRLV